MEKEHVMGIALEKFTWKIEAFSKVVSTKRLSSKAFKIGGYRWKIVLYPMRTDAEHFSLHVKIADSMPAYGWKIFIYFRVALINQVDSKNTIVKETQQKFNGGNKSWDSQSFIPLNEFRDPSQGYLVNDTCIIEVQIATSKEVAFNILDNEEQEDPGITPRSNQPPSPTSTHASNKDDGSEIEVQLQHDNVVIPSAPPMYPHLSNESKEVVFFIPLGELIDFKSLLEAEEAAFIPLWEESSTAQSIVTTINVCVMLFVILAGGYQCFKSGWVGYELPNGYFPYGINGMFAGSALVFFSYIGFDAVTSTAEESLTHFHVSSLALSVFVLPSEPTLTLQAEMENKQASLRIETYEKFKWTIPNFSKLETKKLYSETFVVGGYPWYFTTCHRFNAREDDWGFTSFIFLADFHDPRRGFLVNDTCIIAAEVHVPRSEHENWVDLVANPTAQGVMEMEVPPPVSQGQVSNPLPVSIEPPIITHKEMSSTLVGKRADFRGLGQIEKIYISLLEEACSQHPSLIECQQKRSSEFTEWAFTALGRVLHFLDTKRVKDMSDYACKHLQNLWEELETFRFDLTWLEPHVRSALGMKNYREKAMQAEKLKANVVTVELELKRLKAKVAATEADLDIAKRDLLKVTQSLEGRDLDAKLGYGRP
ncbi:hypothetical protein RIF29_39545 [Crotalaria pallida]|uniref:MATH domain-containing protein n=1 Tax=Crotalaria pallida TaxID=3830 RepID=A0AAN9E1Y1_CROPI